MQNRRSGFTLLELLIVLTILAILGSLLVGALGGCHTEGSDYEETFTGEVLRKYETQTGGGDYAVTTHFFVDVKRSDRESVDTLTNEDNIFINKYNREQISANLLVGKTYQFKTLGVRNDRWKLFPNIISASEVHKEPKNVQPK